MSDALDGTITWVDLSTPDVDQARRFYGELLGWETELQSTEMGDYVVASSDGREVAGMMAQSPDSVGQPPTWTVFVLVEDMIAAVDRVSAAGGTVAQAPFEIPGGARVGVVADRSGAMLALIAGGPEPGYPYFSVQPGAVCWAELMTSDVDAAKEFYGDVFGWTAETDQSGPVPYTICRLGDEDVAGIIGRTDQMPEDAPDSWSTYFAVTDCGAAEQRATELGGSVLLPATPTPMGPFAVLADPSGAAFQVMEISGDV